MGACSATAGETAAGSVQDDVRSDGHQMDGSSPVDDEEGGAFNAHPVTLYLNQRVANKVHFYCS